MVSDGPHFWAENVKLIVDAKTSLCSCYSRLKYRSFSQGKLFRCRKPEVTNRTKSNIRLRFIGLDCSVAFDLRLDSMVIERQNRLENGRRRVYAQQARTPAFQQNRQLRRVLES